MSKETIEQKLEELENFIGDIYVDQMVVKDKIISHTEYKKIGKMFKEIYDALDQL